MILFLSSNCVCTNNEWNMNLVLMQSRAFSLSIELSEILLGWVPNFFSFCLFPFQLFPIAAFSLPSSTTLHILKSLRVSYNTPLTPIIEFIFLSNKTTKRTIAGIVFTIYSVIHPSMYTISFKSLYLYRKERLVRIPEIVTSNQAKGEKFHWKFQDEDLSELNRCLFSVIPFLFRKIITFINIC